MVAKRKNGAKAFVLNNLLTLQNMKLKTLKAHYHETLYIGIGTIYMTDKITGASRVKNGICVEVEDKKRKLKLEKK